MPMKKERYPDNWNEIALAIKEAAHWTCEQCGAKHGDLIVRSDRDPASFIILDFESGWFKYPDGSPVFEYPEEYAVKPTVQVELSVHHAGVAKPDGSPGDPDDKMDNRPENLVALCQRCHLIAEIPGSLPKRKFTRLKHKRQAQVDAGQGELF